MFRSSRTVFAQSILKVLWFKTSHKNILKTVLDVIFCCLWQTVSTQAIKAFTYMTSAYLTATFITIFAHSFFLGIIHMALAITTKCFFTLRATIILINFFKVIVYTFHLFIVGNKPSSPKHCLFPQDQQKMENRDRSASSTLCSFVNIVLKCRIKSSIIFP